MNMVQPLALLLGCQLLGEVMARTLSLPVPGPVVGLVILCAWLAFRLYRHADIENESVTRTADGFLAVLGLLFVPAGVGVVQQLDVIGAHGLALIITVGGSTVITLLATVLSFILVRRWTGHGQQ